MKLQQRIASAFNWRGITLPFSGNPGGVSHFCLSGVISVSAGNRVAANYLVKPRLVTDMHPFTPNTRRSQAWSRLTR
jgi:hypothetical protein